MPNALVTICARVPADAVPSLHLAIQSLGNPASDSLAVALTALDGDEGVHFCSLHALASTDPNSEHGHLVLECSADGKEAVAIDRLVDRIGPELETIFSNATDWRGGDLAGYLKSHVVQIGQGWLGQPGLTFAGTPGMTVGRIKREAALAQRVTHLLGAQAAQVRACKRLEAVRDAIRYDPHFAWALETPQPAVSVPGREPFAVGTALLLSFTRTYLWPLALPLLFVCAGGLIGVLRSPPPLVGSIETLFWAWLEAAWSFLMWVIGVTLAFTIPVVVGLLVIALSLRRHEAQDVPVDRAPDRRIVQEILAVENRSASNHMVSVTAIKPGLTRQITLRLSFWIIGALAGLNFRPGHLGDIGTIHFARWVTLPGTRDLVFFSNYGGSWESYLEDFITKAHAGLTAVWSNSVGFPRTENLFQKGATDGERFKRFARRSMVATPFWFRAYPDLTTSNIRTNAEIRAGLATAVTDTDATNWLSLFGSVARPPSKIESSQIQSLVFGGLGFLPHGELLLIDLDDDIVAAREWLGAILPQIAFDDGRRLERSEVITLALGPDALRKAGLPGDSLETFPVAYLDGMTGPGRSRILGDEPLDPENKWWWRPSKPYDVAILVYGKTDRGMRRLAREIEAKTRTHGHEVARKVPLGEIPPKGKPVLEPFGFVDGVSQPVIRGTYRGFRNADPIHLVEAGEFILGYPDNRGNVPPGPTLAAADDPQNRLPVSTDNATSGEAGDHIPRDIGRNGTFLVIRQLEQDVSAFESYCAGEARRLKQRLGEPYHVTEEFIGAKLVGRWKDGSSLARNPYLAVSDSGPLGRNATSRPPSPADIKAAIAPAASAAIGPDNDFLLGSEDPEGLRCPYGAHIRRANPRDSLEPGSQDQIDISNRHRILRVGRTYKPSRGERQGLIFMCLNGDIERQFEFVQQTWLGSETFHGLSGERDPLFGDRSGSSNGFTIPSRDGPMRLAPMSRFVVPRGGGYFFVPGKKLLQFLCDPIP